MKLRIWHIINPPREPFTHEVDSPEQGAVVLAALWDYDLFIGDGEDKPETNPVDRAKERLRLQRNAPSPWRMKSLLLQYNTYLLHQCYAGDVRVFMNVSGLEVQSDDGEWSEWNDGQDRDISEWIAERGEAA